MDTSMGPPTPALSGVAIPGRPESMPQSTSSAPTDSSRFLSTLSPTAVQNENQRNPPKGQRYVTLPTIPPISVLVPEDSKLAERLGQFGDRRGDGPAMRKDSLNRPKLTPRRMTMPTSFGRPAPPSLPRPQPVPANSASNIPQLVTPFGSSSNISTYMGLPVIPNSMAPPQLSFASLNLNSVASSAPSAPVHTSFANEHLLASFLPQQITPSQLLQMAASSASSNPLMSNFLLQAAKLQSAPEPSVSQGKYSFSRLIRGPHLY